MLPKDERESRQRQHSYSGFWDYRYPRPPQEYVNNNSRRRWRESMKTTKCVIAVCVFFFILALLIGWAL